METLNSLLNNAVFYLLENQKTPVNITIHPEDFGILLMERPSTTPPTIGEFPILFDKNIRRGSFTIKTETGETISNSIEEPTGLKEEITSEDVLNLIRENQELRMKLTLVRKTVDEIRNCQKCEYYYMDVRQSPCMKCYKNPVRPFWKGI